MKDEVREYRHLPTERQGKWKTLNQSPTIPLIDPSKSIAENYDLLWERYASTYSRQDLGNLLDHWELVANDTRSMLEELEPGLVKALDKLGAQTKGKGLPAAQKEETPAK